MSPDFLSPKTKRSAKVGFAVMLASALMLSLVSTVQANGNGLQAYAQSAEPVITASAGYATFSYGLLSVSVTIENPTQGIDTVNVKYYNPDGELEGELDGQISINNGKGGFHCYCFGVERKYVEDNYSLAVTYGEKTETYLVPPYSSMFPQPPDISVEQLEISSDGEVSTSGRVWGGIGGENLTMSVLPAGSDQVLDSTVSSLGLHVQFWGALDTAGQLQVGSDYRLVYHLEGTDITEEKVFTFTGTDQAKLMVDTEIRTGEFAYESVDTEVILYDQDGNELHRDATPAEFLLTTGQQYFVEPRDSDKYVFVNWIGDGSTERVRPVSITYSTFIAAQYRNASEPAAPDFTISIDPPSIEMQAGSGEPASATVTITSRNGFNSEVTLTTSDDEVTVDSPVTPPPDGSITATVSVPSFDEPGRYHTSVYARSGELFYYTGLDIVVTPPGTETAGEPSVTVRSVDVGNGNSEIYGYYTTLSQNGAVVNTGFTPVTFDLASGETYEILVYDYGSHFFNYWVDNGSHVRQRTITAADGEILLTAGYGTSPSAEQDFAISADSPMSVQAGASGASTVTVTSVNGLNSAVTLSMSSEVPGITGSFDANPVIPSPNESETSMLTVNVDSSVPAGDYNLIVTGTTSSGISHSDTIALTVSTDQPPPSGESSVTIRSIDSGTNSPINGYYTILYDSNGNVAQTGFTPATFDLTSGQQYTVEVQDYGSYYFNYWQDDSSTNRDRTFTATDSAQMLTAVYSTSPNAAPPDNNNNEEEEEPQQTTGIISVTTTDSAGNQIYGYYTTLSENGNVVQTAFSPAEFTVNSGQTYQVAVADYGQYVFDHWSDGSTDRLHNAKAGDRLTAVYRP
jgi:hypothetical protein